MHIITLIVGDWSHDGHEETDSFVYESSLSQKELEAAYTAGSKILGFDLSADVCKDYEDSNISRKHVDMLTAHGIECEGYEEYHPGNDSVLLEPELFADLYLQICKLGSPTFVYNPVPSNVTCINIGGYGLFY